MRASCRWSAGFGVTVGFGGLEVFLVFFCLSVFWAQGKQGLRGFGHSGSGVSGIKTQVTEMDALKP